MQFRPILLGLVLVLLSTPSSLAAPNDPYCRQFAGSLKPETFYVATCTTGLSCLHEVLNANGRATIPTLNGSRLQKGKSYRFLYSTAPSDIQNSMVVVQLKHIGITPRPKLADVQLARDALNFACVGLFKKNVYRGSWPANVDSGEALPSVTYEQYDQYHRQGSTSPDEARLLHDNFHARYFDGRSCVSTLEPVRRAQFLLFGRRDVPDRTTNFIARLGGGAGAAQADPSNLRYERFKILLSNYQKTAQAPGCFSFSATTGSPELEISLSDLEEKVRYGTAFDWHLLKTWSFELR